MSGAVASLPEMLGRLKLTAMRDRLDGLLDEAVRRDLTLPEALALLCEAEVAHREERRIQMGLGIAKFPYVRTLEGFDFAAQPSLDPEVFRRGAETARDTMQASLDAAQQNLQHVTDQFTQMLGFTGPQSEEISRRSSENLQAVIEASTVLARGAQEVSQQLFDFVQGQLQRNLDAVNRIARSRSVQDVMAVQSELVRENLQQVIDTNRRVAELSARVADEAARTIQTRASSSAGQARRAG